MNDGKKILLCERDMSGHRKIYLKWLAGMPNQKIFVYAPQNPGVEPERFFLHE